MNNRKTDSRLKGLERAGRNFMLLPPVNLGWRDMIVALPKSVTKQVIEKLAEQGRADEFHGTIRVPLFGAFHDEFKRQVVAPRNAIRTFVDRISTPTSRKADNTRAACNRVITVSRVTDYLRDTPRLQAHYEASKQVFCTHYYDYLAAGREAIDHTLPFTVTWTCNGRVHHGPVSEVLKKLSPTLDEFRASFYVNLPRPRPMTLSDYSGLDLPADIVNQWAEQELAEVEEQLDNAKSRLIDAATKLLTRVEEQLSKDPDKLRLFDTLITEAQHLSTALTEMVDNYDPSDLQLRNAAAVMQEKIAAVGDVERWRSSVKLREESVRAATAVKKVLAASSTILEKKYQSAAPQVAVSTEGLDLSAGMLADML